MNQLERFIVPVTNWMLRFPLRLSSRIVLGAWILLLGAGAIYFGDLIATTTNLDQDQFDQGAYLRLAERNRNEVWPTVTDGTRNPLYPWIVAKFAGSRETMFADGLRVNVWIGAFVLLGLGFWSGRNLSLLPAMIFSTVAFAVIVPVSTYVGTEVVFCALFFAAWMLALSLIESLTLTRCAIFGATLAAAYLAKPSVTLLTVSFVVVGVAIWSRAGREGGTLGWSGLRPLAGGAIALMIFSAMIAPRAMSAWRQFRDPLQNTSLYCFWATDWEECFPILGHLNRKFIDRVPLDQRPSPSRFLERHGWQGVWDRFKGGIRGQADNVFAVDRKSIWFDRRPSAKRPVRRIFPYRGFLLLLPVAMIATFALAIVRRREPILLSPAAGWKATFVVLLLGASLAAFSWYWVIAPGARFIMSLYLPLFASLALTAEAFRRRLAARWSDFVASGFWLTTFAALVWHLGLIAVHPHFDKLKGAF